ncbi:MAG: peptidylprolyl isomerase [Fimbriimonadaceae bacterium]|nr:peptidylprolyl isomerase [Fimbriimonadaceae bacterium]
MRSLWLVLITLASLLGIGIFATGCAGTSAEFSNPPTGLSLNPSNPSVRVRQSIKFTAISPGGFGGTLTWSASAGSITQDGLFTAPATTQNVVVTASIAGGPSTSTNVAVTDGVSVVLTETSAPVLCPTAEFKFTAVVGNAVNNGVVWSATGGTVNSEGQFVADGSGPYSVTARSVEDTTVSATLSGQIVDSPNVRFTIQGKGSFVIALDRASAPGTVTNFVNLVAREFYDGILIHRFEPGFVIQMGDPQTKTLNINDPRIGQGGPGYNIPFENSPLRNIKYSVAMALSGPRTDTAGSQFYVNLDDNPELDGDYCVFGNVIVGQSVIDSLIRGNRILSARTELP